jgi:hypothetical protein
MSFKQAYPAAVTQTGEDYSNIMGGYQDVLKQSPDRFADLRARIQANANRSPITFQSITPQSYNYSRSTETGEGFNRLRGLAETGGYTPEELANLRERGISPIRSVYANAMRNLDRNRALGGGYSPNYAAASGRMARELSEQIAGQTTNVNAGIAERVAAGRQAAIPQFAEYAAGENELMNRIGLGNVEARNRATETNAARQLEVDRLNRERETGGVNDLLQLEGLRGNTELEALRGMQSLYGTTPALANTFGQQAAQAAQLQQQSTGQTQQTGLGLINQYMNRQPQQRVIQQPTIPTRRTASPLRSPYSGKYYGGRQ